MIAVLSLSPTRAAGEPADRRAARRPGFHRSRSPRPAPPRRGPWRTAPRPSSPAAAAGSGPAGFEHAGRTDDGRIQVMVELQDPPAAVVFAEAMRDAVPSDKRARARAGVATRAQVLKIEAAQAERRQGDRGRDRRAGAVPRLQGDERDRRRRRSRAACAPCRRSRGSSACCRSCRSIRPTRRACPSSARRTSGRTRIGLPAGADGTGIRIGDHRHRHRLHCTPTSAAPACSPTTRRSDRHGELHHRRHLPDRQGRRRHRLRGRRLHRRPTPPVARRQPDGLQRPRQPRLRHGGRLRRHRGRRHLRRPLRRQPRHLQPAAHRPRHGAQGVALRPARVRLRRQHRPDGPGHRLGDGPERRQRPLRSPRRHQHVARLVLRLGAQRQLGRLGQRGAGGRDRRHLGRQLRRHLLHRRRARAPPRGPSPRRPRSTTALPCRSCRSTRRRAIAGGYLAGAAAFGSVLRPAARRPDRATW